MTSFEPKQKRSEATLNKIVAAMQTLVEEKYFEQITIAEIARESGMSVGTFYRRFENKEAALPVLYQHFETGMRCWMADSAQRWQHMVVEDLVRDMASGIYYFFKQQRGLMRTIHVYARLRPDLISQPQLEERKTDYDKLASLLLPFVHSQNAEADARFLVFTLVTLALEKAAYPGLTPSIATPQLDDALIDELTLLGLGYLKQVNGK